MPLTVRHFFLAYDMALPRMWEFHDYMATRSDVDYYLHLIGSYPGEPKDLRERSYIVHKWPPPRRSGSQEAWIIRSWNHPLLTLTAVLARSRRIPTLMWGERSGATWEAINWGSTIRIWLRRWLLPILFIPYRKDTIILGIGQQAMKEFEELSHGSPGREFVYPNPVADACLRSVRRQKGRKELPRLMFVGVFSRRKGVDLIIRACETLWQSGVRFRMRYVGSYNGYYDRLPRGLLEEHVKQSEGLAELCPYANRSTLIRYYQEADALLLPSRREGWGLVVQEALAAGIPVITTDACGAADLVAPTGCGRVVPADNLEALVDAISWMLRLGPKESEHVRKKALEVASQLTIPKLSDLLISYCIEALQLRS